jgi:hypothetical protein
MVGEWGLPGQDRPAQLLVRPWGGVRVAAGDLPAGERIRQSEPASANFKRPRRSAGRRPEPIEAAATNVPEPPAPEAHATAESGPTAGNAGYYCGTERWPVKTLSDEDRDRFNLKPLPSTVAAMRKLPRPALLPDNRRAAPVDGRRILRFSYNPATQVLHDQVLDRLAA